MKKSGIKSIIYIYKKFRPFPSKSKVEEKKDVLKRNFNTSRINKNMIIDLQNWLYSNI